MQCAIALLAAPVTFGCATGALHFHPRASKVLLKTRDPRLRRTLESLASRLSLGESSSSLERAIRSRIRDLLPSGEVSAGRVARSLGMSERTLHRRLSESGLTYQDVLDAFRRAKAERLLTSGRIGMTEIALALGFAVQSVFARAFRRWTKVSPTAWLADRPIQTRQERTK